MMILVSFLMEYYSAPDSNAKKRQILKNMGYRKWHFLLIKSAKFEIFHKINILEQMFVYLLDPWIWKYFKLFSGSYSIFRVFGNPRGLHAIFFKFGEMVLKNSPFKYEKVKISKNFFSKSFSQRIFLYCVKSWWYLNGIYSSYGVFNFH